MLGLPRCMKLAIGSDHAGFEIKEKLKTQYTKVQWLDCGPTSDSPVDYPDYAAAVCHAILDGKADRGVLICGSGLGMCMAANKFKGIRAALCLSVEFAKLSREHNDSNVLCLAGRFTSADEALKILAAWQDTSFSGQPRHKTRLAKLKSLENG